ncbi:DNA topoisomerase I, partial [Candidatus Parcubacteria bacterium]
PKCRNIKSLKTSAPPEADEKIKDLQKKYANEVCEKCGAPMVVKNGKFGPFLACSAFPKCRNLKSLIQPAGTGIKCPQCGEGEIVPKRSRRGLFYACNRYPDCKTAFWGKPTDEKCPTCGSLIIETKQGNRCANKECKN